MEQAPCALAAIKDGYVVFANSLFRELAGMPLLQLMTVHDLVVSLCADECSHQALERFLQSIKAPDAEAGDGLDAVQFRGRKADGSICSLSINGKQSGDALIIHLQELSGLSVAVGESADLLERMALAEQESQDGALIWHRIEDQLVCNTQLLDMLGMDDQVAHVWLHQHFVDLLHPEDVSLFMKELGQLLSEDAEHGCEVRMRHSRGHYPWLSIRGRVVLRSAQGQAERVVFSIRDISVAKATEQALRSSVSQQLLFFDLAPVGICVLEGMRITQINRTMVDLFPPLWKRGTERILQEFLTEIGLFQLMGSAHAERLSRRERRVLHHFGDKWLSLSAQGLAVEQGDPIWLVVIEDVSVQESLRRSLAEAKSRAEASHRLTLTLLDNFRHEFNTPLNSIIGFADLIGASTGEPEVAAWSAHIQQAATDLHQKIGRLTRIAKLRAANANTGNQAFSVSSLMADLIATHLAKAQTAGWDLVTDNQAGTREIHANHIGVREAIGILLEHAIRHLPAGKITVRIALQMESTGHGQVFPAVLSVQISIRCNDAGSAKPYPGLITHSPMTPAEPVGDEEDNPGLELVMINAILDASGGSMKTEWLEEHGTTVGLSFPVMVEPL